MFYVLSAGIRYCPIGLLSLINDCNPTKSKSMKNFFQALKGCKSTALLWYNISICLDEDTMCLQNHTNTVMKQFRLNSMRSIWSNIMCPSNNNLVNDYVRWTYEIEPHQAFNDVMDRCFYFALMSLNQLFNLYIHIDQYLITPSMLCLRSPPPPN